MTKQRARRTRGRGRPPSLSREQILETALDLVQRDGRGALTMRAVADELGAGPMSLYTHVRGKDDLLEGVARLAFDRLDLELAAKGSWQVRLTAWMHSLRDQLLRHPELMEVVARQQHASPHLLHSCSMVAGILARAGLKVPAAAEAAQGMIWSALGFTLLEVGQAEHGRSEPPEVQLASALYALPEDERATCERFLPHIATRHFDALYGSLVRRLIAGVEVELIG